MINSWVYLQVCCCCCLLAKSSASFVTQWTVACQASLSIGFPREEHWTGLPFLLQGIFPTQGSDTLLLHCRGFFTTEPPTPLNHLNFISRFNIFFLTVLMIWLASLKNFIISYASNKTTNIKKFFFSWSDT